MEQNDLQNIWNYFLSLERDLDNTSQYIEPIGQEDVHSFEFAKILILSCTEIESVFKLLCKAITGKENSGNIGDYKEIILKTYPKIVEATVNISRLSYSLKPFETWGSERLSWWSAYQNVKHNRGVSFHEATYRNAANALSALYILIMYLGQTTGLEYKRFRSNYICSQYIYGYLLVGPSAKLPDFADDAT